MTSTPIARLDIASQALPSGFPAEADIHRFFASHQPIYRHRKPHYQARLLADLARLLPGAAERILDIGAGSGLMGQAIASMLPGKSVVAVDVVDRFLPSLTIPHRVYDGMRLPFGDAAFDAAVMCNMLHHVPGRARAALLREALRVTGGGPLIVKDHLAAGGLAHARLFVLDLVGNMPFGGMVAAKYLDEDQWLALFREIGCIAEAICGTPYRSGLSRWLFPNDLEISFRVMPAGATCR